VLEAFWAGGAASFEAMTSLPQRLRMRLAEAFRFAATEALEVEASEDGTVKWLLGLADGRRVEAVLIPDKGRATVCVSTQVGCPIACVFCASGVGGLVRNLTAAEIAEQVIHVRRRLGERPSHIVVMGMGEPLLNLENLAQAIRRWTDTEGLGFSPRRITVSTAGVPAWVDRLAALDLGVNLAVSLHAPDETVRKRLVPGSPEGRVEGLVDAAARYARTTGRDATAEYVLIAGENDRPEHAESLAQALEGRHVHVNLIPLNPVSHRPDLEAPTGPVARAFVDVLRRRGVSATLRTRRGSDIRAACGQLALERAVPPAP
jgi:23S rRNA (adenine2503-C2)-methyltransferase